MSALTYEQAKEIWKARWLGQKVRDICARYDVDPRRLYEIWQEDIHKGSRQEAYDDLKAESPQIAQQITPSCHVQRFRIVAKAQQGDLFEDLKASS